MRSQSYAYCRSWVSQVDCFSTVSHGSGRSAAWLARLVRDQEVGGSNPLAPTTSLETTTYRTGKSKGPPGARLGCRWVKSTRPDHIISGSHIDLYETTSDSAVPKTCPDLSTNGIFVFAGSLRPRPTLAGHSCLHWKLASNCLVRRTVQFGRIAAQRVPLVAPQPECRSVHP